MASNQRQIHLSVMRVSPRLASPNLGIRFRELRSRKLTGTILRLHYLGSRPNRRRCVGNSKSSTRGRFVCICNPRKSTTTAKLEMVNGKQASQMGVARKESRESSWIDCPTPSVAPVKNNRTIGSTGAAGRTVSHGKLVGRGPVNRGVMPLPSRRNLRLTMEHWAGCNCRMVGRQCGKGSAERSAT